MKALLFALFVGLLMVGCGEVVDSSKLQNRSGIMYLPNAETPFTGRAESFYENGQKKLESNYKDGKRDGLLTSWWENGQKMAEGSYKDGELDGLMTKWWENGQKEAEQNYKDGKRMSTVVWKPNGEKCPVTNMKDGNGVVVVYKKDGTEIYRFTYKDGELVLF